MCLPTDKASGILDQAKELLDHLESVLSNEPVEVVAGNAIVEVKPQGVSKGGAVERILLDAATAGSAHDVVLCIGDDRSDEDMYTAIEHVAVMPHMPAEVRPWQLHGKCAWLHCRCAHACQICAIGDKYLGSDAHRSFRRCAGRRALLQL